VEEKSMRLEKSLIWPLTFCLFASSCADYKAKSGPMVAKGKEDLQSLNVPVPSMREPSSSITEENLNDSFDIVMNSADPEKEFLSYLNRQKAIYLRAEAYLADFDKELDENIKASNKMSLEDSKSYKKLMVMWGLRERLTDKLIFFYLKLSDMVRDKTPLHDLARSILKKFNKSLASNDPLEKMAYDDFKTELAVAIRERRGQGVKTPSDFPVSSFKSEKEKISILKKFRKQFRLMGKKEQAVDDDLNQKIEDDSDKVHFTDKEGRDPQSLTYYPSTGSAGNVMGLVFPKNVWALTYDDGPNPVHTPAILKNLEDLGIVTLD
jgi:hypothetical protein